MVRRQSTKSELIQLEPAPLQSRTVHLNPAVRWAALLMLITLAAYIPAIKGGFIWDDDMYVTDNPVLHDIDGLRRIWLEIGATPQYYPLVFTSFWLEQRLWDSHPAGYHAVNVLLHGLSAILLWRILQRLAVPGAWLAAAVFALHPVNVESVAWITERKNVLSGVFYLAALMQYLKFEGFDHGSTKRSPNAWRNYAMVIVLFTCALLSKSVTATLPVTILLLLWWKRSAVGFRDLLRLTPMFMLGLAMGLLTAWLEKQHVGAQGADWNFTLLERSIIAGRAIWFYLISIFFPWQLTFIYPRWSISAAAWWQYLIPAGILLLPVLLWLLRDRLGKGPLVALLFFIMTLAPALGFVNYYPMLFSFIADHFQYLACIGPIVLTCAALTMASRRAGPITRVALAGLLLMVLGALTWQQGGIYKDRETLWTDTLRKNPEAWIAENNLASELEHQGRHREAFVHAASALRLRPSYAPAHNNMGLTMEGLGDPEKAQQEYLRAIELEPKLAPAHLNLATLMTGRDSLMAQEHYQLAIKHDPSFVKARYNFAVFLDMEGTTDEAISQCRTALKINPKDADTHCLLGALLYKQGQRDEAIAELREALRLNPNQPQATAQLNLIAAEPPR